MNCRYFEHLILNRSSSTNASLTEKQEEALREHLLVCPSCSQLDNAWRKVDVVLQQSVKYTKANIAPKPEFTERWAKRLEKERCEVERRQLWTTLSIFMTSAGMVLSSMIVWALSTWGTPVTWLNYVLKIIINFRGYSNVIGNSIGVIGHVFSSWEMLSFPAVSFLTLLFLTVVWIYTINKMSIIKRFT